MRTSSVFPARFANVTEGHSARTTNPVSGGELKFVMSRLIFPSGVCTRERKSAAS